jgi:putative sigma-54 modulation protein
MGRVSVHINKNTKGSTMNRQNNKELIVQGIHMELTPSLKEFVREKTEILFRHEGNILRLKVELECDPKQSVPTRFKAKGHIIMNGPPMIAEIESHELHKAIGLMVDKLDRMLRRKARYLKVKRKDTHDIEFESGIPKTVAV